MGVRESDLDLHDPDLQTIKTMPCYPALPFPVNPRIGGSEAAEDDVPGMLVLEEPGRDGLGGDPARFVLGIVEDARGDAREGDRIGLGLVGQPERFLIAGTQQFGLAVPSSLLHRPDGMDHVAGEEAMAAGHPNLAGRAAAERAVLGQQARPGLAVDRPVDATAAP